MPQRGDCTGRNQCSHRPIPARTALHPRVSRSRNTKIKPIDIEKAVYPYLGPGRSENDIEQARAGLEKVYRDLGYQSVYVETPRQSGSRGVIYFNVVEATVGRLRVKGAKYFLPSEIEKHAPSMAEGQVPDFNEIQKDIVALNRWRDRKVTPELRQGIVPGTVDIDLNVEDSLPLHGSFELNNVYNANTVLRLSGSLSYGNLWQLGHTLGTSFQIAPEKLSDGTVFSRLLQRSAGKWVDCHAHWHMAGQQHQHPRWRHRGGQGQHLWPTLHEDTARREGLVSLVELRYRLQRLRAGHHCGWSAHRLTHHVFPFTISYSLSHLAERSFWNSMHPPSSTCVAWVVPKRFSNRRFKAQDNFFYLRARSFSTRDLDHGLQFTHACKDRPPHHR
ncbi:MAG: ShlB/FhaC/HecB family hemolysin secretion/activation protein [Verrucomicrobiaceae bacterium]|nr:ShlB/FhaC/HecB family hemolysin secretion/activation protein [Verrucomicrobiaceae bacterium]